MAICSCLQIIQGHDPISILDYLKIEFQLNTQFRTKLSYVRSNFKKKKKKICMELEFQEIEFHAKNFYKCDCPIFRETYSGFFKPYSDIFNPYSGVFLRKNIFISLITPIPGLGSLIMAFLNPIVTFLSPIAAFSYKFFFISVIAPFREPYSDVLKPYSGVFLQNFL